MGKLFDKFLDIATDPKADRGVFFSSKSIANAALASMADRAVLFELDIEPDSLLPVEDESAMASRDSNIMEFLEASKESASPLLAPFPVTAIETRGRLTLVWPDPERDDNVIISLDHSPSEAGSSLALGLAHVRAGMTSGGHVGLMVDVSASFTVHRSDAAGISDSSRLARGSAEYDLLLDSSTDQLRCAAKLAFEQLAYIMNPDNFILERTTRQSRKQSMRPALKKPPKTANRSIYRCVRQSDMESFVSDRAKVKRRIHAVCGHWRRLESERYKNKRGQRTFVQQHFRGEGIFAGFHGIVYKVMVKTAPDKLAYVAAAAEESKDECLSLEKEF